MASKRIREEMNSNDKQQYERLNQFLRNGGKISNLVTEDRKPVVEFTDDHGPHKWYLYIDEDNLERVVEQLGQQRFEQRFGMISNILYYVNVTNNAFFSNGLCSAILRNPEFRNAIASADQRFKLHCSEFDLDIIPTLLDIMTADGVAFDYENFLNTRKKYIAGKPLWDDLVIAHFVHNVDTIDQRLIKVLCSSGGTPGGMLYCQLITGETPEIDKIKDDHWFDATFYQMSKDPGKYESIIFSSLEDQKSKIQRMFINGKVTTLIMKRSLPDFCITILPFYVLSEAVWWAIAICNQAISKNNGKDADTVAQAERIIIKLIMSRCNTTNDRASEVFTLLKKTVFDNNEIEMFLKLMFPDYDPVR